MKDGGIAVREVPLYQELVEFIEYADSGVKAVEGARVLMDNFLAGFDPIGVVTVYVDDTVDVCFLETFPCISIRKSLAQDLPDGMSTHPS